MNKHLLLILIVISIFAFTSPTFASGITFTSPLAGPVIKSEIENELARYNVSLDHSKNEFGVGADESFSEAKISDGIPYYVVANSTTSNENEFMFAGYIFPLQLNGRPAGLVFATQSNGTWKIFNIKNSLTFDQDLSDAEKLVNTSDVSKLVYDMIYGLNALVVTSETGSKKVLPLKSNQSLHLEKNKFVSMPDFQSQLQNIRHSTKPIPPTQLIQLGGIGTGSTTVSAHSPRYSSLAGLMFLISLVALYRSAVKNKR